MATSSPAATRRASRVSCSPGIATSWASRSTTSRAKGSSTSIPSAATTPEWYPAAALWSTPATVRSSGVTGRRAIHLTPLDERGKPAKIEDIWIDIAVADKDEAESLVRVGDPITYDVGIQDLRNGVVAGRALDNKVGAWVVGEALRRIDGARLQASVHAVATVQEEIGLRGAETSAFGIDPLVAVAVDVTHATDHPNINKKTAGDVTLGGGPTISRGPNFNPVVVEKLIEAAEALDMPVQMEAAGRGTGTDANAIQLTRAGVATGLVSVPLRYMHTPSEVVALADADAAATLLAEFANRLSRDDDFTP